MTLAAVIKPVSELAVGFGVSWLVEGLAKKSIPLDTMKPIPGFGARIGISVTASLLGGAAATLIVGNVVSIIETVKAVELEEAPTEEIEE